MSTPLPYEGFAPLSPLRGMYRSTGRIMRMTNPTLDDGGSIAGITWAPLSVIVDPYAGTPAMLNCRLDLQFLRPGDAPMPIVAGRAPDRTGILFFDLITDALGKPLILAGDRIVMVSGPVFGTFDIRMVPDVAQDYVGAHHVETQVIEVSQALTPASQRPYPGSPA